MECEVCWVALSAPRGCLRASTRADCYLDDCGVMFVPQREMSSAGDVKHDVIFDVDIDGASGGG